MHPALPLTQLFSILPGGSAGKKSACHVGDLDFEDPLEREPATHASILAWTIPWTEEPGRLVHGVGVRLSNFH